VQKPNILAITPPFTQLNTPYPATAYIKGYLETIRQECTQADLGLEVILSLFSKNGLSNLFKEIAKKISQNSANAERILCLQEEYIQTIDPVIEFLQGKNPTLAIRIVQEEYLPEAARFQTMEEDTSWAFGTMGIQDKAKYLATLYLEDLSDLIVETVDPLFGFSRYAERLARSANSFDELYEKINAEPSYTDTLLEGLLQEYLTKNTYDILIITAPFPGNVYASFKVAQYFRKHSPDTKILFGGGFANTELRSLADPRVFEFFHYITLDDGETPLACLLEHFQHNTNTFKRTFLLENGQVVYKNNSPLHDVSLAKTGTPNYTGLALDRYISVIEILNPMHKMWSDGRWNKLTMAHGCYWGKCTFCDISLDYIKNYEPVAATLLVDRMEEIILQTGTNGFHFVDEAAPPSLMKALALEILKRKLQVSWWTNIRFEKNFSKDLCLLLRKSGCVAVSGGLEVASDRVLDLIQKGVTVAQVARVCQYFTDAGIMVHAYLMYGFPSQSAQETIDSLEMVRQLFEQGLLQSGFWHQFALTAHAPVGLNPEEYTVQIKNKELGTFANNDLDFTDSSGAQHERFSFGLKKSLFNYMQGLGLEENLQFWFDFKIPATKIKPDFIENALLDGFNAYNPNALLVWQSGVPKVFSEKNKKILQFHFTKESLELKLNELPAQWLTNTLHDLQNGSKAVKMATVKESFEAQCQEDFEPFWYGKQINKLRAFGLWEV
jgi:hypothetical protein